MEVLSNTAKCSCCYSCFSYSQFSCCCCCYCSCCWWCCCCCSYCQLSWIFFFFVKEFFIANFYPEKELGGYHNFIMPHCLLLPRNNSLFIINNHAGIILFVIDFRIVDADSSNCDFTIRFLIRVHGLPPGSFNPSSVIVLVRNLDTGQSVFLFFFLFLLAIERKIERANQPTNEVRT